MKSPDSHFEDLLRKLPHQKLSRSADRRIKAMIRQRCREESSEHSFWDFSALLRPLIALPMALAVLLVTTTSYGFMSPTVVKGDMLYGIKSRIETAFYPTQSSSERRVNYHLWLSDRRYAEVNEILTRLDADEFLTLVPQARAQDIGDLSPDIPLHEVLMETLQSATQHVDLAFLIVDEVEEVDRVETLKNSLMVSLQNQKNFMTKVSPALQEIKMKKKMRPRLRRLEREQIAQERLKDQLVQESLLAQESAESVPREDQPEQQDAVVSSLAARSAVVPEPSRADEVLDEYSLSTIDQGLPEKRTSEVELAVLSEYVNDRIAFQESLLASMDDTVKFAKASGVKRVDLSVDQEISADEVLQESNLEDKESEPIIRQALVVHFNTKQKLIQIEIAQIKQSQVEQKVEVLEDILEEADQENDQEGSAEGQNPQDEASDELEEALEEEGKGDEMNPEVKELDGSAGDDQEESPVEDLLVAGDADDAGVVQVSSLALESDAGVQADPEDAVDDGQELSAVEEAGGQDSAAVAEDDALLEEQVLVKTADPVALGEGKDGQDVKQPLVKDVDPEGKVPVLKAAESDADVLSISKNQDPLEGLLADVSDTCREEVREACRQDVTQLCVKNAVTACEAKRTDAQEEAPAAEAPVLKLPAKKIVPVIQIQLLEVKPKVVDSDEERLSKLEGDLKNAEMLQQTLQKKSVPKAPVSQDPLQK